MCTPPHPAARGAAERFLATNPGDPATYRSVTDLEERAVDLPAPLFAALRDEGWRLSRTASGETRVVPMPHVTRGTLRRFVADLDRRADRTV